MIGLAAKFDGIAAVGQGRAVIGLGRGVGGNNDLLRGGPAHGQLTVCGRDAVVRGLTRGKLVALHLVHNGRRRRISDLAGDRHCDGVVPDKAGNLRLRQGVRLAVVGEVRTLRGDGHGARGDGQRAVVHDELDVREVRAAVCELALVQTHLVAVRVGALRDGLTGKGEVAHGIELVVDRGGIAGHGMLVAVIAHAAVIAGDGHGDLVGHGGDLQRTLVLLDAVVAGLETRGRGIDNGVRLLAVRDVRDGAGGADIAHLTRNEPVTRDGDIGAGQGCAVVDLLVRGGGQLDGARGDRQLTVGHDERDLLKVRIRILKLLRGQTHRVAVRVGALRRSRSGEGEVRFRIERIVGGNRVAGHGLLRAAVRPAAGIAGDGHNDAADRGNRQLAVIRLGHDILRRGVDGADRILRELRVIRSDVRALRTDGDGAEVRAVGRAGEAGDAVLLAVIGHGTAVRGQGDVLIIIEVDLVLIRADRQILAVRRDGGIAGDADGTLRDGRVKGLAAHGLGGRHLVGRAVPVVVDGVAQVAAERPRAGQGDILSRHLELTAADRRVVRRPAAEHIAVQHGLRGHVDVRVQLVGFIRGQGGRAGGDSARVGVLHLIAWDRPLDAGDGELEGLVAAGEGGLAVCGIVGVFVKALAGGVERHRVGEPIGVGGLAAVGRFYAVCQLPRIGLAIRRDKVVGFCRDADVRPHGVGHGTAADAGGDGGGDGLERLIEFAAVCGVVGIGGVRSRGGGDAVTQEVADQRSIRIVIYSIPTPLFMHTACCPAAVICRAKADRIQAGRFFQRGRTLCRRLIGVGTAIAAVLTGIVAIIRRDTVRQGNDIFAVLGDAAHRRLRELIRRVFKTRIQIRTAIRGKVPDCLHNGVVAGRGGDILPVTFNACTSGKAHEGDIAANARGIALVAVKEIGRRSFCCRKTGLFSFDRIIGEPIVPVGLPIMLTTGCVVILLTTLGAVGHRPGRVEHQHGRGRAGRRGRGGLGGLDLQINPVGVVAERGRFLAQRDGVSATGFILNRPGAVVLCPCRACAVLAVNHVAVAFVFSENRRGQQAQRQTHGHDERENSFFHVYVLSFQILCVLRPPRRQRKRALALLRLKNSPARSCQPQSRLRFPSNGCAGHQHSLCSRIYFTTNHNVRQPFRRNFPINIVSIFHTFL